MTMSFVHTLASFELLALFGNLGTTELLLVLGIGLLLFGRRLPEVGRSLGKGIVEFKKGIKGIEDDVEDNSSRPVSPPPARRESLPPVSEAQPGPMNDGRVSRDRNGGEVPQGPTPHAEA